MCKNEICSSFADFPLLDLTLPPSTSYYRQISQIEQIAVLQLGSFFFKAMYFRKLAYLLSCKVFYLYVNSSSQKMVCPAINYIPLWFSFCPQETSLISRLSPPHEVSAIAHLCAAGASMHFLMLDCSPA